MCPDSPAPKHVSYAELVARRKACRACAQLTNPAVINQGDLDSDRIGPYSRWQGNLDAELLVVAQDFSDIAGFLDCRGWPGASVGTNRTLIKLLGSAGILVSPPQLGVSDDRIFFTNAVLCIKASGRQASVRRRDARECGARFLRPTIELISPRAVAVLGSVALDALLAAYDLKCKGRLIALIEEGVTFDLPGGSRLFPLCHPSPTVVNTMRSIQKQREDWARVGAWLGAYRDGAGPSRTLPAA